MRLGSSRPLRGGQNIELTGHTTGMMPKSHSWAAPRAEPLATITGHTPGHWYEHSSRDIRGPL